MIAGTQIHKRYSHFVMLDQVLPSGTHNISPCLACKWTEGVFFCYTYTEQHTRSVWGKVIGKVSGSKSESVCTAPFMFPVPIWSVCVYRVYFLKKPNKLFNIFLRSHHACVCMCACMHALLTQWRNNLFLPTQNINHQFNIKMAAVRTSEMVESLAPLSIASRNYVCYSINNGVFFVK